MQGNIQSFFAKLKHKLSAGSNLAHTDLNAGCKITSFWQLVPAAESTKENSTKDKQVMIARWLVTQAHSQIMFHFIFFLLDILVTWINIIFYATQFNSDIDLFW